MRPSDNSINIIINTIERENKRLKEENNFYKKYYKVSQEPDKNTIYNNLKVLFDSYAFTDEFLISDKLDIQYQLLAFAIYLVDKLKGDPIYGYIIRYLLYDSSPWFTNNLENYKNINNIKELLNLDGYKLLKDIIEGEKNND